MRPRLAEASHGRGACFNLANKYGVSVCSMPAIALGADAAGSDIDKFAVSPHGALFQGKKDSEPLNKDECIEKHIAGLRDGKRLQLGVASVV